MFYVFLSLVKRQISALLLALCAALCGCADNSFLELTLGLPGRADMRQHAAVRVLPGDENGELDFGQSWRGLEKNFVLLPGPQDQSVSVESRREEVDLGLRVEFCATEFCENLNERSPAEAWFVIQRPFTIGARTRLKIEIPNVPAGLPAGPLVIDCRGGSCLEVGTTNHELPDARVNPEESGVSDAAVDAVINADAADDGR